MEPIRNLFQGHDVVIDYAPRCASRLGRALIRAGPLQVQQRVHVAEEQLPLGRAGRGGDKAAIGFEINPGFYDGLSVTDNILQVKVEICPLNLQCQPDPVSEGLNVHLLKGSMQFSCLGTVSDSRMRIHTRVWIAELGEVRDLRENRWKRSDVRLDLDQPVPVWRLWWNHRMTPSTAADGAHPSAVGCPRVGTLPR